MCFLWVHLHNVTPLKKMLSLDMWDNVDQHPSSCSCSCCFPSIVHASLDHEISWKCSNLQACARHHIRLWPQDQQYCLSKAWRQCNCYTFNCNSWLNVRWLTDPWHHKAFRRFLPLIIAWRTPLSSHAQAMHVSSVINRPRQCCWLKPHARTSDWMSRLATVGHSCC